LDPEEQRSRFLTSAYGLRMGHAVFLGCGSE
jgi:hypothetical protein